MGFDASGFFNERFSQVAPDTTMIQLEMIAEIEVTTLVIEDSYWKWPLIVDVPGKNCDFPSFFVCLPEGTTLFGQILYHPFQNGNSQDHWPKSMVPCRKWSIVFNSNPPKKKLETWRICRKNPLYHPGIMFVSIFWGIPIDSCWCWIGNSIILRPFSIQRDLKSDPHWWSTLSRCRWLSNAPCSD